MSLIGRGDSMEAIKTIGLTKNYKDFYAVNNLCLNIPEGSICGFLGRNGAGKTTAIRMLVGLAEPTSGKIIFHGRERIYGQNDNSAIGYLPDVPSFYSYFTAHEYLDFCGRLYGMSNSQREKRIRELLEKVGLRDTKKAISGYSRGMKQRLGIAQALMNSPQTIFLDEPISALDPVGRYEVMELIRSLKGSVTVFFSTHLIADVESACDYAIIMDHGNAVESGPIEQIKEKYAGKSVMIKFYSVQECGRMIQALSDCKDISYEISNERELRIYASDMKLLGKKIPELLVEYRAALEKYEVISPTLENIFMEVTTGE